MNAARQPNAPCAFEDLLPWADPYIASLVAELRSDDEKVCPQKRQGARLRAASQTVRSVPWRDAQAWRRNRPSQPAIGRMVG